MKKILYLLTALALTSCDPHIEFPDSSIHVGDILCTDGEIVRSSGFPSTGREAIGVVFHLSTRAEGGTGYAVYLHDLPPAAFTDSIGVVQNTTCSMTEEDGNANTYALYEGRNTGSPLAELVFDIWRYGQSAYIPSVAQYRLLSSSKETVNPVLELIGGDPLEEEAEGCWYWTSTEVEGQSADKAWLYSLHSGAIQETPKDQAHKSRPIITINY